MIDAAIKRLAFLVIALFAMAIACTIVTGQDTWVGNRGNLFEGYASQTPLTQLDPVVKLDTSYVDAYVYLGAEQPTRLYFDTSFEGLLQRIRERRIWQFQRPQYYHRAAVMVSVSGGSGSGVIVRMSNGTCVIITCQHVTGGSPSATITFHGGQKASGSVVAASAQYDTAVIVVSQPPQQFVGLPIASEEPPIGADVEVLGFGGPRYGTFRPFVAKRLQPKHSAIEIDSPSIPGDSGSGMVYGGTVVGVQFGSIGYQPPNYQGVMLAYPASSKATPRFLREYVTQACGPYGCQPEIARPGQVDIFYPQDDYRNLPAQPLQPAAPQQPIQPPPKIRQPGCPCEQPKQDNGCKCEDKQSGCDPESIAKAIKEAFGDLKGETGERGLQGPIGPQGPRGPAGEPGKVDAEQIAAIVSEITKNLANNPALKGDKGEKGDPGERGPAGPGISNISMDDRGYVYVEYGVNGRREQIGRLQLLEQSVAGSRDPAFFEIVPKK